MPRKRKATKSAPPGGVWVSPDISRLLHGKPHAEFDSSRVLRFADVALGPVPKHGSGPRSATIADEPRPPAHSPHAAAASPATRDLIVEPVLPSPGAPTPPHPPKLTLPKPPKRPSPPRPAKLALPKPPQRRSQPKPPKMRYLKRGGSGGSH
jgi:hypothetical protein